MKTKTRIIRRKGKLTIEIEAHQENMDRIEANIRRMLDEARQSFVDLGALPEGE